MTHEQQIRNLILSRAEAVHQKDVEATGRLLAPDVVMFDVITPLRYAGAEQVRERTSTWFDSFATPIGYEVRDLTIAVDGSVAFAHFVYRVSGSLAKGGAIGVWVRATICLRRLDGQWRITHEHDSVPFDPDSGKAALDLEP